MRVGLPIFPLLILVCSIGSTLRGDDGLQFGFGKADITPTVPLRLSGYASRAEPSEGVDEPLLVRAMAMRPVATTIRWKCSCRSTRSAFPAR